LSGSLEKPHSSEQATYKPYGWLASKSGECTRHFQKPVSPKERFRLEGLFLVTKNWQQQCNQSYCMLTN